MDKRLIYTLPLILVILVGWQLLAQKMGWARKPEKPVPAATSTTGAAAPARPAAASDAPAGASDAPAPPPVGPVVVDDTERTTTLTVGRAGEPGYYRAVFTNRGGALLELRTGNHFDRAGRSAEEKADPAHWMILAGQRHAPDQTTPYVLKAGPSSQALVRAPLESALWRMRTLGSEAAPEGVEFELAPGTGVAFTKRFQFVPGADRIRLELEVRNEAVQDVAGFKSFVLNAAAGIPNDSGDSFYSEPQAFAASVPSGGGDPDLSVQTIDPSGSHRTGSLPGRAPLLFAGAHNKYFALILRAADADTRPALASASWRALRDEEWLARHPGKENDCWRQLETDVDLQLALPAPGASRTWSFDVYAGPKLRDAMVAVEPGYAAILKHDLGFTSGIARLLVAILRVFESVTQSWGFAIILLTLLVRAVLFPLNRRSQTAMARYQAKMKRVQPRIEEIKKRYQNDPQKLRQEQARIMQEEGAFPPLGGCLPPLLQLPIFIGLFRAIGVSFDLRHAPFLGFITDLSLPDRLIPVDVTLPLLGHVTAINVLPPLMVVLWIWQQRTMPMPTDDQAKTMYKMMMWMPVVMGIFLYNYAAGLSLYMITQSGLGIFEQKFIRKHWPLDDTEQPKKKSGFMQKLLAAQEQRMKQIEAQRRGKKR